MTTINTWLINTTSILKRAGIETPRLDATVLLCDELRCDKAWLFAYPEHILQIKNLKNLHKKIIRRCKHEPLAYIRGRIEFYGRDFRITPAVLVPRPESESIIDLLKMVHTRFYRDILLSDSSKKLTILDIGTGSGVLAITAIKELSNTNVYATDTNKKCIQLAQSNANDHQVSIKFVHGSLLEPFFKQPLIRPFTNPVILLCNLPYVPNDFSVNRAVLHEPASAVYSHHDGLYHYRELFNQIRHLPFKPSYIITESLKKQHSMVGMFAHNAHFTLTDANGLAQCFQHSSSSHLLS